MKMTLLYALNVLGAAVAQVVADTTAIPHAVVHCVQSVVVGHTVVVVGLTAILVQPQSSVTASVGKICQYA